MASGIYDRAIIYIACAFIACVVVGEIVKLVIHVISKYVNLDDDDMT